MATTPDYTLDFDRSRTETLHAQACQAITKAIRARQEGFHLGDRLSASELAHHSGVHRNTMRQVMAELVRQGYLRRLPNRGFEIVERSPERPNLLTRHILCITEVAQRNHLQIRSQLITEGCGLRQMQDLKGRLSRVVDALALSPRDRVSQLTRSRLMKAPNQRKWPVVAIEETFVPLAPMPDFLDVASQQIAAQGDFSVYRQLRRAFPLDEFFKAHYEISLLPLPEPWRAYWTTSATPMNVLTVTYCSIGPIEVTYTWFDSTHAVLLAGSLDIQVP